MAPDHYHRLVHVRGWTTERYRHWLATGLTTLLADPPARSAQPRR
jgi:hypothetical protein